MVLWSDGNFADTSPHGAAGIAHACAEQFRQRNEGHRSGPERMTNPRNDNRLSMHMSHRTRGGTITDEHVKRMRRAVRLQHVLGNVVHRRVAAEPDAPPRPFDDVVDVA